MKKRLLWEKRVACPDCFSSHRKPLLGFLLRRPCRLLKSFDWQRLDQFAGLTRQNKLDFDEFRNKIHFSWEPIYNSSHVANPKPIWNLGQWSSALPGNSQVFVDEAWTGETFCNILQCDFSNLWALPKMSNQQELHEHIYISQKFQLISTWTFSSYIHTDPCPMCLRTRSLESWGCRLRMPWSLAIWRFGWIGTDHTWSQDSKIVDIDFFFNIFQYTFLKVKFGNALRLNVNPGVFSQVSKSPLILFSQKSDRSKAQWYLFKPASNVNG